MVAYHRLFRYRVVLRSSVRALRVVILGFILRSTLCHAAMHAAVPLLEHGGFFALQTAF